MKLRARHVCVLLALAAATGLSGCHSWGFSEPVEPAPPPHQTVSPSGLRWEDLRVGEGTQVVDGSRVSVNYTGRLEDGVKFDSSLDRGVPFEFVVGRGNVIPGWDEGMLGMRVGGTRRMVVPPERAYGSEGRAGVIPPNATLVLEIELLAVD
jgi:FKBP-type peptidyl-prolyl cis-trans isomerase